MLGTFANIHRNFAEIEVYHLQTFVDDESIKDASIDLVASVLYAIEITVAFFASKTCWFSDCYSSTNRQPRSL